MAVAVRNRISHRGGDKWVTDHVQFVYDYWTLLTITWKNDDVLRVYFNRSQRVVERKRHFDRRCKRD